VGGAPVAGGRWQEDGDGGADGSDGVVLAALAAVARWFNLLGK